MRLVVLLAMVALGETAVSQAPRIRAHLEPAGTITVGEPVKLVVTVLVPNYFTGSPEFPEFELDNAIVVLPQETPQNSSERVEGMTYAAITESYTLYPQQPGHFSLPPAQITVSYAGSPPKSTSAHLALPSLAFLAAIPEAARGLDYFLPTTKLTMEQRWTPAPKALRVGDTVERSVTVTAEKMQAMLIPPLKLTAPDGIRIYEETPDVHDEKSNRNEFLFGRRTESVKYLIQKEGSYTLPAIELKWWNLSTERLMTAVLPAVHIDAAANPGAASELPPDEPVQAVDQPVKLSFWSQYKHQVWIGFLLVLGSLLLLWLGLRLLPKFYRSAQRCRVLRRDTEPAYFRRVVKACNAHQAMDAYRALLQWFNRRFPGKSLDDVYASTRDTDLIAEIDGLSSALFAAESKNTSWNGKRLAMLLKAWRGQETVRQSECTALANLNP